MTDNAEGAQNCAPVASLSQTDAAKLMNTSRRGVQQACVVLNHGIPELIAACDRGEMAVSLASEIARAPADVQREAVEGGWAVAKSIAKRLKQERRDERRGTDGLAAFAAWHRACDEIHARRATTEGAPHA